MSSVVSGLLIMAVLVVAGILIFGLVIEPAVIERQAAVAQQIQAQANLTRAEGQAAADRFDAGSRFLGVMFPYAIVFLVCVFAIWSFYFWFNRRVSSAQEQQLLLSAMVQLAVLQSRRHGQTIWSGEAPERDQQVVVVLEPEREE